MGKKNATPLQNTKKLSLKYQTAFKRCFNAFSGSCYVLPLYNLLFFYQRFLISVSSSLTNLRHTEMVLVKIKVTRKSSSVDFIII